MKRVTLSGKTVLHVYNALRVLKQIFMLISSPPIKEEFFFMVKEWRITFGSTDWSVQRRKKMHFTMIM